MRIPVQFQVYEESCKYICKSQSNRGLLLPQLQMPFMGVKKLDRCCVVLGHSAKGSRAAWHSACGSTPPKFPPILVNLQQRYIPQIWGGQGSLRGSVSKYPLSQATPLIFSPWTHASKMAGIDPKRLIGGWQKLMGSGCKMTLVCHWGCSTVGVSGDGTWCLDSISLSLWICLAMCMQGRG